MQTFEMPQLEMPKHSASNDAIFEISSIQTEFEQIISGLENLHQFVKNAKQAAQELADEYDSVFQKNEKQVEELKCKMKDQSKLLQ